jgi:MarR family transcriptional regulator, lower aerobic nicotinate degradation pathway regulator
MHLMGDDDDGVVALNAIRNLVRMLGDSARTAQGRTGITGAQLFVVRVLAAHPAGLSINELGARTMTHQSSVSVVVSRLVAAGVAVRAASSEDRRRQIVTLTRRGRGLHRTAPAVAQERLIDAVCALSKPHRRTLATCLARLTDAMGISLEAAPMFFEDEAGRPPHAAPPRPRRSARHARAA